MMVERQDRIALWGILIGLALTVIAMALPLAGFDIGPSVYRAILLIGLAILLISAVALARDLGVGSAMKEASRMWPTLLMVVGAIAFSIGLFALINRDVNKPASTSSKRDLTLNLLWRTDFNSGASYKFIQGLSVDLYQISGDLLGHFDFGVGLYGNFNAKSVFVSLYVPATPKPMEFIEWFADGYKIYLDDARKNFHI
jgi:hypothetical protein